MRFNRIEAKLMAKESMRLARPSPLLVSLVYILLTAVLTSGVSWLLGDPTDQAAELLIMGYAPEEVLEYMLSQGVGHIVIFGVVSFLLDLYSGLMQFGYTSYALRLARREEAGYGSLFDGFSKPLRVLWANFLVSLFTTLWGLLGMLPGMALLLVAVVLEDWTMMMAAYFVGILGMLAVMIVVGLRYRLTHYFILDDPECTARQAIARSKETMRGWKMELFTLDLSFLGWDLLAACTAGILMVWVGPYQGATEANFYDALAGRARPQSVPPRRYAYDPNADGDGPTRL